MVAILGEARQRREVVSIALAVATGVEEQNGKTGRVQGIEQRQQGFGVAAPAVQHDHGLALHRRQVAILLDLFECREAFVVAARGVPQVVFVQ